MRTLHCFFILLLPLCIACSSLTRSSIDLKTKPKKINEDVSYILKLNPDVKSVIDHDYRVVTLTTTFDGGSIAREKEEITTFTVRQKIKKKNANAVSIDLTSLSKNGPVDLRDLIMPRVGETLSLHLAPDGSVEYAEGYPSDSAFYLSPISLPNKPVKVGDTWTLKEAWNNEKTSMPMEIELVSILKGVYIYENRRFAEIETSGEVLVPVLNKQKVSFKSEIVGRILLDIDSGNVAWSEIRNEEHLKYPEMNVHIRSCMELKAVKPQSLIWPWASELACDPASEFVYAIPGN